MLRVELLTIAKKNLFKNKIITGLILSSVALVVCCLILLLAINEAGKREIAKEIKERGNLNRVLLDYGVFTEKGYRGKVKAILSPCDLRLIKNSCPAVKEIGFYTVTDIDEIRIGNRQYSDLSISDMGGLLPNIFGASPACLKVLDMRLKEGRFINKIDMLYKRRVCVLGGETARVIGHKKVIGKELITKNPDGKFTIIGVLHKKMPLFTTLPEEMGWKLLAKSESEIRELSESDLIKDGRKCNALEVNSAIYIPFTTWQDFVKETDTSVISIGGVTFESKTVDRFLFSSTSFPGGTFVWMKIDTPLEEKGGGKFIDKEDLRVFQEFYYPITERLKEPLNSIRKVLRKKYGEDKFFRFTNYGSLRDELEDQMEDSRKLLGITFLFSLLLSGIILTSFMLVSVQKRVSEIGVLRAFGARKKDIFLQFLAEGTMIYSVGIIIGIVVGILGDYLIVSKILHWEFSIPYYGIIISSVFVFLVGILSSVYPALKAANIPPAVAVRYE